MKEDKIIKVILLDDGGYIEKKEAITKQSEKQLKDMTQAEIEEKLNAVRRPVDDIVPCGTFILTIEILEKFGGKVILLGFEDRRASLIGRSIPFFLGLPGIHPFYAKIIDVKLPYIKLKVTGI